MVRREGELAVEQLPDWVVVLLVLVVQRAEECPLVVQLNWEEVVLVEQIEVVVVEMGFFLVVVVVQEKIEVVAVGMEFLLVVVAVVLQEDLLPR